ncbi:hypothetical protein Acsp05_22330 [Actinokineospora sp. NBRC 105648]|nr:hypothetical protein Acsp05_22330 [Actinokineospora sp. NBRC 105648]
MVDRSASLDFGTAGREKRDLAVAATAYLTCGLADHLVTSDRLPELLAYLKSGSLDLVGYAVTPPPSRLAEQAGWIDVCFAVDTVEEILDRLAAHGQVAVAKEIEAKSPTALKVTLAALRRARELSDVESVLVQEYRVSAACLRDHDLVEGIRAQVIDKDRDRRRIGALVATSDQTAASRGAGARPRLGPQGGRDTVPPRAFVVISPRRSGSSRRPPHATTVRTRRR